MSVRRARRLGVAAPLGGARTFVGFLSPAHCGHRSQGNRADLHRGERKGSFHRLGHRHRRAAWERWGGRARGSHRLCAHRTSAVGLTRSPRRSWGSPLPCCAPMPIPEAMEPPPTSAPMKICAIALRAMPAMSGRQEANGGAGAPQGGGHTQSTSPSYTHRPFSAAAHRSRATPSRTPTDRPRQSPTVLRPHPVDEPFVHSPTVLGSRPPFSGHHSVPPPTVLGSLRPYSGHTPSTSPSYPL